MHNNLPVRYAFCFRILKFVSLTAKSQFFRHVSLKTDLAHRFVFPIRNDLSLKDDEIAFAIAQRKWAMLSLGQEVEVQPFGIQSNQHISLITVAADFQFKKRFVKKAGIDGVVVCVSCSYAMAPLFGARQ